jgi:hypothetical protein
MRVDRAGPDGALLEPSAGRIMMIVSVQEGWAWRRPGNEESHEERPAAYRSDPPTAFDIRTTQFRRISHEGHLAGPEVVDAANNPKLLLGYQVGQDRLCLLQPLNVVTHVGDDSALLQISAGLL